jgi:hypothetical protein
MHDIVSGLLLLASECKEELIDDDCREKEELGEEGLYDRLLLENAFLRDYHINCVRLLSFITITLLQLLGCDIRYLVGALLRSWQWLVSISS